MNKNTNPWMLATIFLLGIVIGFGTGRSIPGVVPQTANNLAVKGTDSGTVGAANTVGVQPATLQTDPQNSYANTDKSTDGTGHYSIGNKNAKVKIVEFSDFQCPFCYRYFAGAFPKILNDYVATGKVYYSYYNFPLNIHPQAPKAAEASLCAGEQNKYWEYHDLLFANQNVWSGNDNDSEVYAKLAQSLSLDGGKFSQCLTSGKYASVVSEDTTAGEKKSISGTPTLFINDQKIVGAQDYYVFKKAIEDELKK